MSYESQGFMSDFMRMPGFAQHWRGALRCALNPKP